MPGLHAVVHPGCSSSSSRRRGRSRPLPALYTRLPTSPDPPPGVVLATTRLSCTTSPAARVWTILRLPDRRAEHGQRQIVVHALTVGPRE